MIFYSIYRDPTADCGLVIKNPYEVYFGLSPMCNEHKTGEWFEIETDEGTARVVGHPRYNYEFNDWTIGGFFL